jgi:hypothetical protein
MGPVRKRADWPWSRRFEEERGHPAWTTNRCVALRRLINGDTVSQDVDCHVRQSQTATTLVFALCASRAVRTTISTSRPRAFRYQEPVDEKPVQLAPEKG